MSRIRNWITRYPLPTVLALAGVFGQKAVDLFAGNLIAESLSISIVIALIYVFHGTNYEQAVKKAVIKGMIWVVIGVTSALLAGGFDTLRAGVNDYSTSVFVLCFIGATAALGLARVLGLSIGIGTESESAAQKA